VLKLTPDARDVLSGRRVLKLRKPSEAQTRARKSRRGETFARPAFEALDGESQGVFQALREWRKEVAREHGVPAYTVFHDATLQEIARRQPASLDGLRGISGIGEIKLERYGEPILQVVRGCASGTSAGD
jgi:ATP-dependent DNA helicase RecQ